MEGRDRMKFSRFICNSLILISFIALMSGCTEDKGTSVERSGYILHIEKNRILLAENINSEKFEEIKNKPISELNEESIPLIYLSSVNTSDLKVGDEVEAVINGGIDESQPAQAEAKEINLKK
jgi:hypothetical protein